MKKIIIYLMTVLFGFSAIFLTFINSTKATTYETKNVYTTADAVVKSLYPDNNFAVGTQLWVENTPTNKIRSFMYFDLSGIPSGSTIITATVQVRSWLSSGCWGDPGQFYLSLANAAWNENTITWNNKPGSAINASSTLACADGYQGMDAKYPVQQIINGANANHGFFIVNEAGPTYLRTFFSRENGQEYTAKISVFYSLPEPTPTPQPSGGSTDIGSTTTGTTTGTSQPGITAGSKVAPASKTSAAIKPPGELLAIDAGIAGAPSINLSWKKSETTNIDGYKIFRSEKETEGFENIANADKNTLTYTDIVGDEKTYYYIIRTYKGTEESASSNTASASAKKFMEEKAPTTEKPAIFWQKMLEHRWLIIGIAGGIVVLALAGILLYKFWWLKRKKLANK